MSAGDVIKQFLVSLGYEVDEKGQQKFIKGVEQATVRVAALGAAVVAMAGVVVHEISKVADEYNNLNNIANRTNTPVEKIEELGYVASLTGSSIEAAQSSLEGLGRNAGLAAIGMGRAKKVFEEMHISVKDGNGKLKETSALMLEISKGIQGKGRGEQIAILSRLGIDPSMIRAMTEDISGFQKEFADLMKATGIDSKEAAQQSTLFHNSMFKLKYTMEKIWDSIILKVMPAVGKSIESFREKILKYLPQIQQAFENILPTILKLAGAFIALGGLVIEIFGPLLHYINELDTATDGWSTKILALIIAWRAFNLAFMATPLGILLSLGALLAVLIQDWLVYEEGGKSAFGGIWQAFDFLYDRFKEGIHTIIGFFRMLGQIIWFVATIPIRMLEGAFTALGDVFDWIHKKVMLLVDKLIGFWDAIKKIGKAVGDFFDDNDGREINVTAKINGKKSSDDAANDNSSPAPKNIDNALNNISKTTGLPPVLLGSNAMSTSVNQSNITNVYGASDPQATADAVGGVQNNNNATLFRNIKGQAQ